MAIRSVGDVAKTHKKRSQKISRHVTYLLLLGCTATRLVSGVATVATVAAAIRTLVVVAAVGLETTTTTTARAVATTAAVCRRGVIVVASAAAAAVVAIVLILKVRAHACLLFGSAHLFHLESERTSTLSMSYAQLADRNCKRIMLELS